MSITTPSASSNIQYHDKGLTIKFIRSELLKSEKYNLYEKEMNTSDHGTPQHRKRLYFFGILKDIDSGNFEWPKPIKCQPLSELLDKRDPYLANIGMPLATANIAQKNVSGFVSALVKQGHNPFIAPYVIACDSTPARSKCWNGRVPTMTKGQARGFWITDRGRRMNVEEMMRLQGMDPRGFKLDVTKRQLAQQLGNAISLNVLERIMFKLIPAAGLGTVGVEDRWESGEAAKDLDESRDVVLNSSKTEKECTQKTEVQDVKDIKEFLWQIDDPEFKYCRLPNTESSPKWEQITRIVHRCSKSLQVVFDEKVDDENRHDAPFWELGCNRSYGLVSIYFFKGEVSNNIGKSKKPLRLKRRHAEKARFVTSFGIENRK